MLNVNQAQFDEMDLLSQNKKPFFFMVDFLMQDVKVYTASQLAKQKEILIQFPGFSNSDKIHIDKEFTFQAFPQDFESYKKGFDIVQENLRAGNSYLLNYTCKTPVKTSLSLREVFYRSQAKYKVLFRDEFVFFSPETFVEVKDHKIFTHPMKGTIDAELEDAAKILRENPKEKAEHYTVIDLLRNDLSMVADNVQLTDFQRIDHIKSRQKNLLAMSSEISGELKPEFRYKTGTLMKTLLPAGSILGAPKRKTLEIILQAETFQRGFYTGVCGWFDGENLDSCVMIRFIEKENNQLFFKSGGGITHLSKAEDEYNEMKNKIYVPIY